ncbi:Mitochondrial glycoprotein [Senna tora]|uniref:Mitochondrial glycoprotein n=1 Tax=Senna tora TaxID=362788 RepID=A0A834WNB9_9FABA|nr:Mitochondrial glycoprotein [Senna tora]
MAMYSMLRRASSSVLPLAFRAVASPRTFHGAVSAVRAVGLSHRLAERILVPSVRFAKSFSAKTSADENLIRVLETEIKCAEEEDLDVENAPDNFPFTIEDHPGERTILLKRLYEDETITVQVDIPNVAPEEGEDDDEESHSDSSIPLVVNIYKRFSPILEFGVTAFPDEISIDSLSIKNSEESEDQLAYEGPEFHDLDENLQKAFHKFLEIRGIKPSTTNFLHEYMIKKDTKEYHMWLKNLKKFIET